MRKRSSAKPTLRLLYALLIVVFIFVIINNLLIARLAGPLPILTPKSVGSTALPAKPAATIAWPSFGQSAIGLSGYGLLATHGPQTPVPTASVAKIITALAVLRVKPIAPGSQGATITLGAKDIGYYEQYAAEDGSVVAVTNGETISEYQVLQGMMLPSANNLADSLAVWAFGSLTAYSNYANQMLSSLGMAHTHVGTDASGFSPTTTSTASDLVHLGEISLQNPVLAGIFAQPTATIPVAGDIKNVNWLLGTYGIDGVKTGNNNQDAGAFLFSAAYKVPGGPQITFVGTVMDGSSLNQALASAVPLLVSSEKALSFDQIIPAGTTVGQYDIPWGGPVSAVTTKPVKALAWQNKLISHSSNSLSGLTAPQSKTVAAGTVGFTFSNQTISTSPVVLDQPIAKPSVWWRLLHN